MHCLKNCFRWKPEGFLSPAVERQGQTFDALKMQKGYSQLRFPCQSCETNLGQKKILKPEMLWINLNPCPAGEGRYFSQATLVLPSAFPGKCGPYKSHRVCLCACLSIYVCSVVSDSLWPHGLEPTRFLCPWNSLGKNTGMGCHFLPTQG